MSESGVQRLGNYLLIDRLGEGGMAEVYLAQYSGGEHSVGPASQVVVKRIKPSLYKSTEFPVFREMFLNEAKLVRSLQHPNLARMYALLEAVDDELGVKVPFIVGEYIRGTQLWELMRLATQGFTGKGVPPAIAAFVAREVARGLGHAHAHKDPGSGRPQPIIHRDISPENIMVSQDGHVKVIDFGVAKALGGFGPQTRTGIIKGKLAYMAPEQVAQKVVPATDVFGAGIVLHELLTGRRLFGGSNEYLVVSRVLKAEIPRPSSLLPGIPKELDDVTMQALSRDLRGRFVDGNAMADALTRLLQNVPSLVGTTNQSIRDWAKQLTSEAKQLAQGWEEQESGLHVDVQNALAHSVAKGEDIVELNPADLLVEGGQLDPGVKAAVTMGLKTLRPDMLKSAQPSQPPKRPSSEGYKPPPLPGARPAANRVSTDALAAKVVPKPDPRRVTPVEPSKSPVRALIPVVVPDPAASTVETVPAKLSSPEIPPLVASPNPSAGSIAGPDVAPSAALSPPSPADATGTLDPVLPQKLAFLEPHLPPLIRSALRDDQVKRLALVISALLIVLLLLLFAVVLR
ncbi:MAG TPA: protein kinase [Pseudomonadota bacterium]|nr:protein kinase [Pseudomonadota bacterium]